MTRPFSPVGQLLQKISGTSNTQFDRHVEADVGNGKKADFNIPEIPTLHFDVGQNVRRLVSSIQKCDAKRRVHAAAESVRNQPDFASISLTDSRRSGKDLTNANPLDTTTNVKAATTHPPPTARQQSKHVVQALPDVVKRGPAAGSPQDSSGRGAADVPSTQLLPLWEKKQGRAHRYVWSGTKLVVAAPHELEQLAEREKGGGEGVGGTFMSQPHAWGQIWHRSNERNLIGSLLTSAYRVFVPDNVSDSYWDYMKWKGVHKTSSSIQGVFATQSMLHAVGVGSARQLPAAAALNWVLKDGLGRIGRLLVAGGWGKSFDYDLKRKRFMASVVYTASTGLETLLPLCPQLFLPVATLANIGKSIGVTAHMATNPPILHSFVLSENMGDVSAKGTAQHVIADNLGLGIAILLTNACRGDERKRMALALGSFPILAGIELCAMYREIKAVELKTLNKERAELIAEHWLARGRVPDPKEVSQMEPILFPVRVADGFAPLRIGSIGASVKTVEELRWLLATYQDERYMLTFRPGRGGDISIGGSGSGGGHVDRGASAWVSQLLGRGASFLPAVGGGSQAQIMLALREDARGLDVLQGLLQAAHLRHMLRTKVPGGDNETAPGNHSGSASCPVGSKGQGAARDSQGQVEQQHGTFGDGLGAGCKNDGEWSDPPSGSNIPSWEQQLLLESRARAKRSVPGFLDDLAGQQWHTKNVMLSPAESVMYSCHPPRS
eukprot:jgi/Mesvir1/9371/Mv08986-RA.1